MVSTHSRLKAAGAEFGEKYAAYLVSTHSRLKAAGNRHTRTERIDTCFNTQPPEGGWAPLRRHQRIHSSFNTQPPEGGWQIACDTMRLGHRFNTQPPEGGWENHVVRRVVHLVSTHSRLKAAGMLMRAIGCFVMCFNTQPPEGGWRSVGRWRQG